MNKILEKDIPKIMADTANIKLAFEILEKDHNLWDRDMEQYYLDQIVEIIKQLQNNVTIMMIDYYLSNSRENIDDKCSATNEFHQAFNYLSILFDDFKDVKDTLKKSLLGSTALDHIAIDWFRLTKTVDSIQKHLVEGAGRISSISKRLALQN